MEQNRRRTRNDQGMPNRSPNTEQPDGSRQPFDDSESIRNRPEDDLGTSSDRAMFEDRASAEERDPHGSSPGASGGRGRSRAGGITNRPLDLEQGEQEQLPLRGRFRSESED